MTIEDEMARYRAAGSRIQAIVTFWLRRVPFTGLGQIVPDDHQCSPKHLRVGVECALAGGEALAALLVEKGLVTQKEMHAALAEALTTRADTRELEVRTLYPQVRF